MPFFNSNRLNWPTNGDINAWADFVETICMFSEGDSLSMEDFIDFLKDDASKTTKNILTAVNFNERFLPTPIALVIPAVPIAFPITGEEDEGEEAEGEFDGDDPENEEREQIRSRLLVLFAFLEARQRYFGELYPFTIIGANHMQLNAPLTRLQTIYQILLLSSEMRLFTAGDTNRVGHLFEALCKFPFAYLLPAQAQKKFFGAGAGEILDADYEGNLYNKLVLLAADIAIKTNQLIEHPDELGPSGDAGLDWVGWVSFNDNCDHQPVYFGQCACGANWIDKQHETSLSIWRNYLEITQSVQCFHFMPRSFRRTSLDWFRRTEIVQDLTLIDRYRLLKIFETAGQSTFDDVINSYNDLLAEAAVFEYE